MKITALLINHNSNGTILKGIQSLIDQDHPVDDMIVVDNGSTDDVPAQIRQTFPDVNVIELRENSGLSHARNVGLSRATGDLILMLDDDVYLSRDALKKMIQAHREMDAAVICPRIVLFPDVHILQCDGAEIHFSGTLSLRHAYQQIENHPPHREVTGGFIGACLLMNRENLMRAGAFDEEYFFYFEDLELSYRLKALGYPIFCEETAIAFHEQGDGTDNLSFRGSGPYPSKRAFLNLRNRWQTIWIHYQARTLLFLAPALIVYELAALIETIRRGWGIDYMRALISVFRAAPSIRARRKRHQRQRTLSDRSILTGGDLPLARGFVNDKHYKSLRFLNNLLTWYWNWITKWL